MPRQILVADDDEAVSDIVRLALEDNGGCAVICAGDCDSAEKLLDSDPPHLAIIDAGMRPGQSVKSGLGLAISATRRYIPVILMTAHPTLAEALKALPLPLLCKPFRVALLQRRVQDVLEQAAEDRSRVRAAIEELLKCREEAADRIAQLEVLSSQVPAILAGRRRGDG
jgi:two-component system, OmpR family, alkaline phosphatase synthesis response regulator PhoP